jgi:hypothetical protein
LQSASATHFDAVDVLADEYTASGWTVRSWSSGRGYDVLLTFTDRVGPGRHVRAYSDRMGLSCD